MCRVRGTLLQTSLVIVSSIVLIEVEPAGAASSGVESVPWLSFYPPSSAEAPVTLTAGASCEIECIAHGMYSPSFKWFDSNWNSVGWSSEVVVRKEMRYWKQPITLRCRARSSGQEVEAFYTFQVADAHNGPEAWVIAVAVTVPVVVLAAIAIAAFFIIRRCEKKKMSKDKTKTNDDSTVALLPQD